MEITNVIKIIETERECISRQQCDRQCQNCDLVMNSKDILDAYDYILELLENKLFEDTEK